MLKTRSLFLLALPLAAVALILSVHASRSQQGTPPGVRWEYQVIEHNASECSAAELQPLLSGSGEEGWELVSIARIPSGQSEIVLQTASLGYGKEVVPNLADSWQGVITPLGPESCQLVLKRPVY